MAPHRSSRLHAPAALAALAGIVAALVLVPGYRDHGLWSTGEIGVLQRAQAALGAALTGLERSPVLPDLLRTRALALTDEPAAVRLPGALAAALLVALAVWLARRLGAPPRIALVAGGVALAAPILQTQGRLALGNPVGELLATLAALLGAAALAHPRPRPALALALAALAALAAGLLSAGLVLGVLLPLLAIATAWPTGHVLSDMSGGTTDLSPGTAPPHLPRAPTDLSPGTAPPDLPPGTARRLLAVVLAAAILGVAGLVLALAWQQADGWIPALAAARDPALVERPSARPFTAGFEDLSNQLFPWLPLLLVGLLHPGRARWPALWLLVGLVLAGGWSLRYGPLPLPLTVPAAVVCAAGLEHLLDPRTGAAARRLGLLIVVAGGLILAKDVRRTPSRVGALLVQGKGEHTYPARELGATDLLGGLATLAALAVVAAALARRPADPRTRAQRLQARLPEWLPAALVLAALGHQALRYGQGLLPRTSELLSLHRPLTRHAAWRAAGDLPGPLGVHRISDPGVDLYGPPPADRRTLASREATIAELKGLAPTAALIRASELAPVFQASRAGGWPLYVLDASHRDFVLVGNTLPPGAVDENPIRRVLHDAAPELPRPTFVRFEDYLEVIGWDWEEPVVRGRETTLRVALRVLRPLPSGSKIYMRLQKERISRINPAPHDLAGGIYPTQHWRPGDYVLHEFTTTVPLLEILPGAHDVVLGMRRTESSNYKISSPEGEHGEPGVTVQGKREFATIGQVQVW